MKDIYQSRYNMIENQKKRKKEKIRLKKEYDRELQLKKIQWKKEEDE